MINLEKPESKRILPMIELSRHMTHIKDCSRRSTKLSNWTNELVVTYRAKINFFQNFTYLLSQFLLAWTRFFPLFSLSLRFSHSFTLNRQNSCIRWTSQVHQWCIKHNFRQMLYYGSHFIKKRNYIILKINVLDQLINVVSDTSNTRLTKKYYTCQQVLTNTFIIKKPHDFKKKSIHNY